MELCETDCLDDDIYDICDMDDGEATSSGTTPPNINECSGGFGLQSATNDTYVNGQTDLLGNKFAANFRRDNLESNKSNSGKPPNVSANASPSQRKISTTKQRSFTTSILVSPLADRKFHAILPSSADPDSRNVDAFGALTDQRKTAEKSRSYQRLYSPEDSSNKEIESKETLLGVSNSVEEKTKKNESVKRTLCSGEVVVDIKKVFFNI